MKKEMVGKRVGKWLVISEAEHTKGGNARWLCRCDCGKERIIQGGHLRSRYPRSCGCGKPTQEERFWCKVKKGDGCWEWLSSRGHDGYGRIERNGGKISAHRLSWELHFGIIPMGMCVCHHCDNPVCVRPDHLFLGTRSDNQQDMAIKHRGTFGERHPRAKLTEGDVLQIRALRNWASQEELARRYGVGASTISGIQLHQRWRYLREKEEVRHA